MTITLKRFKIRHHGGSGSVSRQIEVVVSGYDGLLWLLGQMYDFEVEELSLNDGGKE